MRRALLTSVHPCIPILIGRRVKGVQSRVSSLGFDGLKDVIISPREHEGPRFSQKQKLLHHIIATIKKNFCTRTKTDYHSFNLKNPALPILQIQTFCSHFFPCFVIGLGNMTKQLFLVKLLDCFSGDLKFNTTLFMFCFTTSTRHTSYASFLFYYYIFI